VVADITVTNTGTTAINGWTLSFTFPGDTKVTSAWNMALTQTGQSVSATNLAFNAAIPAGGNQTMGFQGTWTSNDAAPTAFRVNGSACS
jgi:hypothetical protein